LAAPAVAIRWLWRWHFWNGGWWGKQAVALGHVIVILALVAALEAVAHAWKQFEMRHYRAGGLG